MAQRQQAFQALSADMPRSRNIKPGFFANDHLAELSPHTRLLFIALWTLADREGRLEDRPKKIRAQAFPYEDVDVGAGLQALAAAGFIQRYEAAGDQFIQVVNFGKHQNPHHRERESEIPAPGESGASPRPAPGKPEASPVQEREKVRPGPADSLNLIPDSFQNRSAGADHFADFWEAYPKKVKNIEAHAIWKRKNLDLKANQIIADVRKRKAQDGRWLAGYVPDPTTYLRGQRWNDAVEPARSTVNGSSSALPRCDDDLESWAKLHNLRGPRPGESGQQYRHALHALSQSRSSPQQ